MNPSERDQTSGSIIGKRECRKKYVDIAGQKFGKLTVIRKADAPNKGNQRAALWLCRCECGKEKVMRGTSIRFGTSRSCGCDALAGLEFGRNQVEHGMSDTWQYNTLQSIMQRCTDKNCAAYPYYGGRGITFDPRWAQDRQNFFDDLATLGERMPSYSLDRIDANGSYVLSNLRWASKQTQSRNRRNNINLTFQGETKCLAAWAESMNIDKRTLWIRVKVLGWPTDRALTQPVKNGEYRSYNKKPEVVTVEDWS